MRSCARACARACMSFIFCLCRVAVLWLVVCCAVLVGSTILSFLLVAVALPIPKPGLEVFAKYGLGLSNCGQSGIAWVFAVRVEDGCLLLCTKEGRTCPEPGASKLTRPPGTLRKRDVVLGLGPMPHHKQALLLKTPDLNGIPLSDMQIGGPTCKVGFSRCKLSWGPTCKGRFSRCKLAFEMQTPDFP